jgi:hypothetical protein
LFFAIRRQSQQEPDEVLDGGTFLQFTYGNRVEIVQMSDIADVEIQRLLRLTRVILHPHTPTNDGGTIGFYPNQQRNVAGQNEVAVALQRRIKAVQHA